MVAKIVDFKCSQHTHKRQLYKMMYVLTNLTVAIVLHIMPCKCFVHYVPVKLGDEEKQIIGESFYNFWIYYNSSPNLW